jgi:hypothetical protein
VDLDPRHVLALASEAKGLHLGWGVAAFLPKVQGLEPKASQVDRVDLISLIEQFHGLAEAREHADAVAPQVGRVVPHHGHAEPLASHMEAVVGR